MSRLRVRAGRRAQIGKRASFADRRSCPAYLPTMSDHGYVKRSPQLLRNRRLEDTPPPFAPFARRSEAEPLGDTPNMGIHR